MPLPIEDYAMVGDLHTAALIGRDGSIDWLCLPRFDSPSMFGALLGSPDEGRWLLAPSDATATAERSYEESTFTLVTRWTTPTGVAEVIDVMPLGDRRADLVRRVRGITGTVDFATELRIRFDYAAALPWVRKLDDHGERVLVAVAGPDAVVVRGVELTAEDHAHHARFTVAEGAQRDLVLTWYPSHRPPPDPLPLDERLASTSQWWRDWADSTSGSAAHSAEVRRSLLVLRALTHEDTGGIVAAATTSLPEEFGGERNWDYRYVWLRDASLTLQVLLDHGFRSEAEAWRRWLLRAIAGDPADVQIMYGLSGERRLDEWEAGTLPGYLGASPVRVGNEAYRQFQGDVFGHVMLALQAARRTGADEPDISWPLQRSLIGYLEERWRDPDNGIWEIRGPRQYFTHSRVMLWAAFDCAVRAVREDGHAGPADRWERIRDEIRDEIEERGWDAGLGSYTQVYGSDRVDASLLQLPQVGYLAADDPRMLGTVAAIERELLHGGLLLRYRTESGVDGLPAGEHPFLACTFWLVEQYARSGRRDDAQRLMDRLCGFANDVGLLSEQYDPIGGRQAGNTPQALTHLALVRAADALAEVGDTPNGGPGIG